MPPVITAVGWALAGAAATSATAIAVGYFLIGAATVIGYGLLLVGANAMQQRAKRKARDRYNASQVDRLQSLSSTTGPRELVLGKVRKGGAVVFRDSCGEHNEKFVLVIALASHKINGVEKFYLNEKEVTLDSEGYVQEEPYRSTQVTWSQTGQVVPGSCYVRQVEVDSVLVSETVCQYAIVTNYARIRVYDGSQTTADSRLMSLFPGVWTSSHKLLGVAYAIIELDYSESAFPSGIPNFTALLRGAEVYDPRTGTNVFSENPALHARHIVTHPRFGKRTNLTSREEARLVAAANACDTSYTPSGGVATQLYKSSVVLPYGGQAADALDDLCQGMCGMWAYAGGEFFIKAGVYTAPVKTLQASDLMTVQKDNHGGSTSKPITINTHKARADKINSVVARIYDSGSDYKETTLTPVKNAQAITKDGQELPLEITLPVVGSASQAQVICNYLLKDSFDPLAIVASFKLSAYELELFDNVALNLPRFGWSNKVFTVLGKTFSPTGSIELTLRETSAELFNPLVYSNSQGFASNTNLVEPWDIDPPGILTLSSGTADLLLQGDGSLVTRVRVQWPEILDERIRQGGYVELRWKSVTSDTWSTITVPGVESSTYLLGVIDGETIAIAGRTRTQLAVSNWNVQKTHTVLGKSEPPAAVQNFTVRLEDQNLILSWAKVLDLDLAGYEVRTSNTGWGEPGEVYRGSATTISASPVSSTTTWYIRSFDRSDNYSAATAQVSYTAPTPAQVTQVSHVFADTSLTAATITLSWKDAVTTFGYDYYEIAYNGTTITVKASTITVPANWIGNRDFSITTVDRFGFKSSTLIYPVTKLVPAPAINFRSQVIDNNVLLYWTLPAKTSLPIAHSRIRKGETWTNAEEIGTKDGEFTTIFELAGGEFKYWLAIVDTDGYESTPVSLTAAVTQPPDFLFLGEQTSDFSGTKVNARQDLTALVLPVSLTETFEGHFNSNSWTGPSAQVSAGYPIYIQPGVESGYYEETFDFGTVVASSSVTVTAAGEAIAGNPSRLVTMSLSDDLIDWTTYSGSSTIFATNFRYVKVRFDVVRTSVGDLYRLEQLSVRLDTKTFTDSGTVNALASDVGGTPVNFNFEILDVLSINTTVNSTTPRIVVYDFRDETKTGTYTVSANVATVNFTTPHGLRVGQTVRFAPTSGTLTRGVYTIASVPNTNSFTFPVSTGNTSGGCVTYPNSFTVYVYDSAGVRQTNTVSWNIRGS
jgi:hypothetical protein